MRVRQRIGLFAFALLGLAAFGCASVPMAGKDRTDAAKTFQAPPDMAHVYVYRPSAYAWGLRFPIVLDEKLAGELPGLAFLLAVVAPGEHTVMATSSKVDKGSAVVLGGVAALLVSPNEKTVSVTLTAEAGKNYYLKILPAGVIKARIDLTVVTDEKAAQADISTCSLIEGM